jgi:NAD-dependent deacetylase
MNETASFAADIDRVARLLTRCRSLLFITGAGISAESGLPTYRGVGGLYDVDTTAEGFAIEEILSGTMLSRAPQLTWKYLRQISDACRRATFNRAHAIIAELERQFDRVWVVTQNVDGFHRAAGSQNVIDVHGDLRDVLCTRCAFRTRIDDERQFGTPPGCPECGSLLRPDVVLFGEMLPSAKTDRLYAEVERGFDIVFSIGTTSVFHYIALPVILAQRRGTPTVEINPGQSEVTHLVDIQLPLTAGAALSAIWERLQSEQG